MLKTSRSTLLISVMRQNIPATKKAIARGDSLELRDDDDYSALDFACFGNNFDIVKLLVEAGADINAVNNRNKTALRYAVGQDNEAIIEYLLDKGADVNVVCNRGSTALIAAAYLGAFSAVKLLAAKGAKLDVFDSFTDMSPVMLAASEGDTACVDTLIESGADIHQLNRHQASILFGPAYKGKVAMIKKLIALGVDVNHQEKDGVSALHHACHVKDNNAVIIALIEAGANTELRDNKGLTPYAFAASCDNDALDRLIRAQALKYLVPEQLTTSKDDEGLGM